MTLSLRKDPKSYTYQIYLFLQKHKGTYFRSEDVAKKLGFKIKTVSCAMSKLFAMDLIEANEILVRGRKRKEYTFCKDYAEKVKKKKEVVKQETYVKAALARKKAGIANAIECFNWHHTGAQGARN